MTDQLPLHIGLRDAAAFDNYYCGPNREALVALRDGAEPFVYLWGAAGVGKTHLLQALCRDTAARGATPAYLAMDLAGEISPTVLEGLEALDVVCIDDLDRVAGCKDWEAALFDLYNRLRATATRLCVAARAPPQGLNLALADLQSRLAWGPVYHLRVLDDPGKAAALELHARTRGLELSPEVARYLLRRCPRDTFALFDVLERLDRASLAAQRRLTVPFVRRVLLGQQ